MKRAFYDFSVSPYSWDFLSFLLCAKSYGAEQIVFVPGKRVLQRPDGSTYEFQKCDELEQKRRLSNLLLPLCKDAVICLTREDAAKLITDDIFPPNYTVENPTIAHMLGHVMQLTNFDPIAAPDLVDDAKAELGVAPVVIVIRETQKAERNSDIAEWLKAADWMRSNGMNVWFVPDTSNIDRDFGDFNVCKRAAIDVRYRIAVSQVAGLTLGVANGPLMISVYSRRPVMMFKPMNEAFWETSADYWIKQGIPPGSQIPWFTPEQRIIWEGSDTAENIIANVKKWLEVKGGGEWGEQALPAFPVYGAMKNDERHEQIKHALSLGYPKLKRRGKFRAAPCSIVGYGPSLNNTWQNIKGPIVTVSGAHDFLIEKGVIPNYHVECDPREHKAEFLKKPHKDVHYLIASCVHPKVWEQLKGHKVTLWHLHNGPGSTESIQSLDPGADMVGGGTTAGLRAMEVMARKGFRRFMLHGMDCSFAGDEKNAVRHAGAHSGKRQSMLKVRCGARYFLTSPQMVDAANWLLKMLSEYDIEVQLFGDGLQQQMVREAMKDYRQKQAA